MWPIGYNGGACFVEVRQTRQYERWFKKLRDRTARFRIDARIAQIQLRGELLGDYKSVGDGVIELRFDSGPGYRVYLAIEGAELLLLLAGGDKSSQVTDIAKARELAAEWRRERRG